MVPSDYGRYKFSVKELESYLIRSYLVMFVCAYVFYGNLIFSLIVGLLCVGGLGVYRKLKVEERRNSLRLQFKDMLYSMSSSITSGRHLKEAIEDSEEAVSLINGSDAILTREIRHMCRLMQETNCSAEDAFRDLAVRSGVKEIMDFSDVCMICQYTGGNLADMISKAVMMLTQNIELQREKDVLLSQKKLESRILVMMPVLLTALTNLAAPDYLESMYTTLIGRFIMTVALLSNLVSFLWSMKLIGSRVQM